MSGEWSVMSSERATDLHTTYYLKALTIMPAVYV